MVFCFIHLIKLIENIGWLKKKEMKKKMKKKKHNRLLFRYLIDFISFFSIKMEKENE